LNFKYSPNDDKHEFKENPLIQQIIRQGITLLQLRMQGQTVDWKPFINCVLEE
jgi:hypothetical protein